MITMNAGRIHPLIILSESQEEVPEWSRIQGKIREGCWGETRWELKRGVPNSGGADQSQVTGDKYTFLSQYQAKQ